MIAPIQHQNCEPGGLATPPGVLPRTPSPWHKPHCRFNFAALLAAFAFLLLGLLPATAHQSPVGCSGSGLGIDLFAHVGDVHIGDTLRYSVRVFNSPFPACDATEITAEVVTPDGVTNSITSLLRRNALAPGESDFYTNVVAYVVRAQDIRSDGTVRATAADNGVIHQNDTNSKGGGNQGVNTEVNLPCIQISAFCVGAVGENGAISFTGTVTNCGNSTLAGITITNFVNNGFFAVSFPTTLAIGASGNFSGSWIPANPCVASIATLTVLARDEFTATPRAVTSFTTLTCQNTLTAGIKVTKTCPVQSVSPGSLLTFSGTVSNTGNVTLTNIVVVNDRPAPNSVVFTLASLAPGAVAQFTGSYVAPVDCSVTDTLTASANSRCGVPVINTATATCAILTTPLIAVTAVCPVTTIVPGGSLTYNGTVRNLGNVTLTNVVVTSDRPAANTVVFAALTMAPGSTATFFGTYTVPTNACTVTTTFTGVGRDACNLAGTTNQVTTTCTVTTAPAIAVTLVCPVVSANTGGPIVYTGVVRNSGNVTLNNVIVVNNHPAANTTVLGPITLAPGASSPFTASFTAPLDACSVSSTVNVSGSDNCTAAVVTGTASATCALITTPGIVVTQLCPTNPVVPGGLLTYSGTVRNSGNITLSDIKVLNSLSGATPVFTVASLAPGATAGFTGSFLAPTNCSISDTLTATALSSCGIAVTNVNTSTCAILTTPQIVVVANCPATLVVPGGSITYTGTVRNAGNIALTDVVIFSDRPVANTPVFTIASLAPGASTGFSSLVNVPANACSVTTAFSAVSKDQCSLNTITNISVATCKVTTAPAIAVTLVCPVVSANTGGPITYSGIVRNTGNVTLNNIFVVNNHPNANTTIIGPVTLGPGGFNSFEATFTAPLDACSVSSTVVATGNDDCTAAVVTATASATCNLITAPGIVVTQLCPTNAVIPGGLLTYSGTVRNSGNITLSDIKVLNSLSGATPVFTVASLAPGAIAGFTGSFLAPTNCSISDTLTATAVSSCGISVTNINTASCPILTTPQIVVTANCPTTPVVPGGSITYNGTVRNAGNITLTNVTILSDRPVANTPVFTIASLAPGASAAYSSLVNVPANACSVTTVFSAVSKDLCSLNTITNIATATCNVTTAPAIGVTLVCPVVSTVTGGLITYTGTVMNSGNVTLNNVFVVNNHPAANTPVIGPITLAPGASSNFLASFTSPLDACSVSSTVIATGSDNCTALMVTNTASATCTLLTTPGIAVTQACPVAPAIPGGLLTYSGTVRNTGNISLANVVVLNNLSGSTPVFTLATLAPGVTAAFTGSFLTPTNCSIGDILTVTGLSTCGVAVSNTTSATCPILTHPAIFVSQTCPTNSVLQGGLLTYTGVVRNIGDIVLTNVIVFSDRPGSNTVVFTQLSLAPGASAAFGGSYLVPSNCCVVSSTVLAVGQGCAGVKVSDTATRTCTVQTFPSLAITKICVPGELRAGDLLSYSGSVSNSGNITLFGVTVENSQTPNRGPIFGPAILAPGESFEYTASYIVPADFCGTDTVTAKGLDVCTLLTVSSSVTTTCPVITPPARIAVTKDCPSTPTPRGGLYTYTGSVRNPGLVTLINVYVVNNQPSNNTPVIGPITLAPGEVRFFNASYIAPRCCCQVIDTLTARGEDRCTGAEVKSTATAVCPLLTAPEIGLLQDCPANPIPMGSLYSYSGFVTNSGDTVLTNVFVFGPQGTNSPVLGPIELAPGESEYYFGTYQVPSNTCLVTITARGQDVCAGLPVIKLISCPVATAPDISITETCPAAPVVAGTTVTFTGIVKNIGNITLTNVLVFRSQSGINVPVTSPLTLLPGASAPFLGNYVALSGSNPTTNLVTVTNISGVISTNIVVKFTPNNVVTVTGTDICENARVIAGADCLGPVIIPTAPGIQTPTSANGVVGLTFPTEAGKSLTVQYKDLLSDPAWKVLEIITGTGRDITVHDPAAPQHPTRFYRVISTQ